MGDSLAGMLQPPQSNRLSGFKFDNYGQSPRDPNAPAWQLGIGGGLNLSYRDDDPLPESGWVRIDGDGPLDNADRDVSSGQSYGDFLGAHGYQRSDALYMPGENDGSLFVAGRLRPRSVPTGPVTPLQPGLDGAPPSNSTPGIGSYLSDFWDDVKRTLNWSTPNAESTGTGVTYKNKELTVEEYQYAQAQLESQRTEAYSNRMAIADKWDRYILANPGNAPEPNLIHVTPIEPGKDKGSNVLIYPVEEVNGMLIMGNPISTPGKFDNVIITPRPEIRGPSIIMSQGNSDPYNTSNLGKLNREENSTTSSEVKRPKLVDNTKHIPGGQGFRSNAGTQPADAHAAYENAISLDNGKTWYAKSTDKSAIYRYFNGRDGTAHWSGSTADSVVPLNRDQVPAKVIKEFGFKSKGGKWK